MSFKIHIGRQVPAPQHGCSARPPHLPTDENGRRRPCPLVTRYEHGSKLWGTRERDLQSTPWLRGRGYLQWEAHITKLKSCWSFMNNQKAMLAFSHSAIKHIQKIVKWMHPDTSSSCKLVFFNNPVPNSQSTRHALTGSVLWREQAHLPIPKKQWKWKYVVMLVSNKFCADHLGTRPKSMPMIAISLITTYDHISPANNYAFVLCLSTITAKHIQPSSSINLSPWAPLARPPFGAVAFLGKQGESKSWGWLQSAVRLCW